MSDLLEVHVVKSFPLHRSESSRSERALKFLLVPREEIEKVCILDAVALLIGSLAELFRVSVIVFVAGGVVEGETNAMASMHYRYLVRSQRTSVREVHFI